MWVKTPHEGLVDLYRYAKGRGAVSRSQASGQRYLVVSETEVTSFPGATDARSPQPVLSTASGTWLGAAQGIGTGGLQRLGGARGLIELREPQWGPAGAGCWGSEW